MSGIEQPDDLGGANQGIRGCDVRAFLQITADAGEAQVIDGVGTAVLDRDDMIDLMRK